MEEALAYLLMAIADVCCQFLAAGGADLLAALAAYEAKKHPSSWGWWWLFWCSLPIAILLTLFVIVKLFLG
jgi:hypothetical protein